MGRPGTPQTLALLRLALSLLPLYPSTPMKLQAPRYSQRQVQFQPEDLLDIIQMKEIASTPHKRKYPVIVLRYHLALILGLRTAPRQLMVAEYARSTQQ
jgi:hypothetical protein